MAGPGLPFFFSDRSRHHSQHGPNRYKAISEEDKSFGEIYLAMKFIPIADDGFQNDLFKPCDTDKYRVRSLLYLCFVMRVTL